MPLQRFLQELQCSSYVPFLGDVGFRDLGFVIDGAPHVLGLAINLHKDLVEMPAPMAKARLPADPLTENVGSERRPKAVPSQPDCLITIADAALEQQVFQPQAPLARQ